MKSLRHGAHIYKYKHEKRNSNRVVVLKFAKNKNDINDKNDEIKKLYFICDLV
jgi:hypothetical protein